MEKRNVELRASFFEALLNDRHTDRRSLLKMAAAAGIAAPAAMALVGGVDARQATPTGGDSTGQKGGEGTLIVSISGDPLSFNPDFQVDDNGFVPASNIYNKVVTLDHSYGVLPDLAQTWDVSEDGLTITFHLVTGATWHDGTPFTAKDVKYTIEMIVNTASAAAASLLSAIESVDAVDDATAVFHLKQPSASLIPFLGWYGTYVLPAHIYEGSDWATNAANQSPVGTGPYKFGSYEAGTRLELDANLEYWGEGPYTDKLVFSIIPDANTALQAFLNGESDVMLNNPPLTEIPNIEATDGVKVEALSIPSYYYFGFNVTGQYTSDPAVRKAISQALDREQIVKTALGGYGDVATTYYPPQIAWAANTDADAAVPSYDPEAAKAVLDEKFPVNGDFRFKLVIPYFTASPEYGDICTVAKEQLKAVNIDVELVALEIGAWSERMSSGDFDMGMLAGLQGPDPDNLKIRIGTGGSVNFWNYSNPEVDTLLSEGGTTNDQAARAEKYWAVQKIMATDVVTAPISTLALFYPYAAKLTGLPFVEGIGNTGLNVFAKTHIGS